MNLLSPRATPDVPTAKHELRVAMRALRAALPADQAAAASAAAARHLLAVPEMSSALTVALYAPLPSELSTALVDAALRARGAAVCYPRVVRGQRRLAFHRVADLAALRLGTFGISEPPDDLPIVAADHIDVFVVPGLAFDRAGRRLGYGQGYYDATIAAHPRALPIGYAFELQIVAEVPAGARDALVRCIVTERGAYRCDGDAAATPSS